MNAYKLYRFPPEIIQYTVWLYLRRPEVGYWRWFEINNGSAVSNASPNLWASTSWKYRATGDYDGDVLLPDPVSGFWLRFTMESGVSRGSGSQGYGLLLITRFSNSGVGIRG